MRLVHPVIPSRHASVSVTLPVCCAHCIYWKKQNGFIHFKRCDLFVLLCELTFVLSIFDGQQRSATPLRAEQCVVCDLSQSNAVRIIVELRRDIPYTAMAGWRRCQCNLSRSALDSVQWSNLLISKILIIIALLAKQKRSIANL